MAPREAVAAEFGMERKRPPLPIICMSMHQFEALPEYSCTLPTGTVPGKMWRRHDGAHDLRSKKKPVWMVMQYGEVSADGKSIALLYFRPVLSREMTEADIGWPQCER